MSNKRLKSPQSKGLSPDYLFRDVTDITPQLLKAIGIKFLMMDLDNTIAAYDEHVLSDEILQWINEIRNSGIKLFVISNSTRRNRLESLFNPIRVGFIMRSFKPSPKSLLWAMELSGFNAEVSALAGDQVFTDGLAAKRAGVTSIIVRPRRFTNPFLAIRYFFELPFRAFAKEKHT